MKTIILSLFISTLAFGSDEPLHHLKTVNAVIAKAAVASYNEGHYRYIQNGQLVEAQDVDTSKASCVLESGKMKFNTQVSYKLQETRSLDIDAEVGEIELTFETGSNDPDSYFQIYCFQGTPNATLDTAREGLQAVFEID
jgi:hypothetical protein